MGEETEEAMRATHYYVPGMLMGIAAMLSLACDNSTTRPPTGAIVVTVSTVGADTDVDPDGYAVIIDSERVEAVGVNATVMIGALRTGNHLLRLAGLAGNCSLSGTNPLSVDVLTENAASSVSFSVSCIAKNTSGDGDWDY